MRQHPIMVRSSAGRAARALRNEASVAAGAHHLDDDDAHLARPASPSGHSPAHALLPDAVARCVGRCDLAGRRLSSIRRAARDAIDADTWRDDAPRSARSRESAAAMSIADIGDRAFTRTPSTVLVRSVTEDPNLGEAGKARRASTSTTSPTSRAYDAAREISASSRGDRSRGARPRRRRRRLRGCCR